MAVETELKLSLPAAAAAALRRHPLLAAAKPAMQRLANVYYDTPDLDLLRAGVALRHRRNARGWLLTVKSAEPASGGLARRSEWEAPSQPGVFDFSHVDDKRLRRRLERLRPALQPAFVTDFRRSAWLLEPAAGVRVELAFDRGSIRHGERAAPICEVELELLAGPPSALFDLALALQADLPLRPESASKAERGYRLFRGEAPQPARAGASPLAADMAPLAAFRAVAFDCLDQLLKNEAGAHAGDDPEFVHQARVAVRRLRSALRFWAPLLPADFAAAWRPAWRDFAQRLGAARNLDVFVGEVLPPLLAAFPGHRGLRALPAQIERQRARARREVRAAFTAPVSGRLALAFAAALHALPDGDDEVALADFAARRLRRQARAAARLAAGLAAAPETHHRLRIAAKHLRYALEFLAPLYPKKALRRYLGQAAALQEVLGRLNDVDFAQSFVAGRRGLADADLLRGWLAGQAVLLREGLPAALRAFLGADAPWRARNRRR